MSGYTLDITLVDEDGKAFSHYQEEMGGADARSIFRYALSEPKFGHFICFDLTSVIPVWTFDRAELRLFTTEMANRKEIAA